MLESKRYIIVGDVHGCLQELKQLLFAVNLTTSDTLVMIGDLLDKGNQGPETVRYIHRLSKHLPVKLIWGNHEEKNVRFFRHVKREKEEGISNPMSESPGIDDMWDNYNRMSEEDIEFIESESLWYYKIPEYGVLVTHGGIPPKLTELLPNDEIGKLSRKKRKVYDQMLRVRHVRGEKVLTRGKETSEDPFWAEVYDGRFGHVYFGHEAVSFEKPGLFRHATGIDLGCIYGGYLCAAVLTKVGSPTFVTVPYGGPPEDIWSEEKEK